MCYICVDSVHEYNNLRQAHSFLFNDFDSQCLKQIKNKSILSQDVRMVTSQFVVFQLLRRFLNIFPIFSRAAKKIKILSVKKFQTYNKLKQTTISSKFFSNDINKTFEYFIKRHKQQKKKKSDEISTFNSTMRQGCIAFICKSVKSKTPS